MKQGPQLASQTAMSSAPAIELSQPLLIAIDIGDAQRVPDIHVLTLVDFRGTQPVLSAGPGLPPVLLTQAPLLLTAILLGDRNSQRAERFLAWLAAVGYPSVPIVLEWRRGHEAAALLQVNREMVRLVAASAARQAETVREAARLRASNGELHYRFAVAENALLRTGTMPLELAFSNDPVADPAQFVTLAETEAGIAQILPTGSNGVSAIGIHFAPGADAGNARLAAQLRSLEDERTLEQWIVAACDLTPGWNVLGLARTLSGQARTLELSLSQIGGEDRLPPLSLGTGQPITSYQIRDIASGQPALRNSLAIQIWTGLAGTRMPGWFKAHTPTKSVTAAGGFIDVPLPPLALTQAEHANPDQVTFDFPAVVGPPGEGVVLCHPPSTGITLARLGGVSPAGAMRLSASAFIDNQQSRDVDFALIVTDDPSRARAIGEGSAQPAQFEAFSGWNQVGHSQVKRLSAFRDAAAPPAGIYVATRMSRPGDNSFARARLKDFSVMVQA
ncbi:DUF6212 domain-containing protein [uncultured Devosia sp.]|uniref:DUF6212 domain-containing protein n=1 Tax=uncultured Devosia sp. TaxID=211434 RepID=UPI0035CB2947